VRKVLVIFFLLCALLPAANFRLRDIEGWDWGTVAQGWWADPRDHGWVFSTTTQVSAQTGASGAGISLRLGSGQSNGFYRSYDNQQTWRVDFFIRVDNVATASRYVFLEIRDGGTVQIALDVSDGKIRVVFDSGATVGTHGGPGTTISINEWHHVRFETVIDNTVGYYKVYLDGVNTNEESSIDTQTTANAYGSVVAFGNTKLMTAQVDFDDIIICDYGGADVEMDTMPLQARVVSFLPVAEATYSQFTPSSGTDNAAMVDNTGNIHAGEETDYTYSSTAGHIDSFTLATLTPTAEKDANIVGIRVASHWRMDSGTGEAAILARVSGVDNFGTTTALNTDFNVTGPALYLYLPGTSTRWTTAIFNASEFGYKFISDSGGDMRVIRSYAQVAYYETAVVGGPAAIINVPLVY